MNWLTISVIGLLAGTTIVGYIQGLMKKAITLVWLLVSLILVGLLVTPVSQALREHTGLHSYVAERASAYLTKRSLEEAQQSGVKDGPTTIFEWQAAIEDLDLPGPMEAALQSKSQEGLSGLKNGLSLPKFAGRYIADVTVGICGYLLTFILVATILRLILLAAKLIDKLPVVKTLNHVGGAALGLLQGLVLVWLAEVVLAAFAAAPAGRLLYGLIWDSPFLRFLHQQNLILRFVTNIF